jgi:pectate lyase
MLVEANAFFGKTRTAATTYGLVIPEDSPNTSPDGDFEIDGYMNLGKSELNNPYSHPFLLWMCYKDSLIDWLTFFFRCAENYFGDAIVNITQVGNFTKAPYKYKLTDLYELPFVVLAGVGVGQIWGRGGEESEISEWGWTHREHVHVCCRLQNKTTWMEHGKKFLVQPNDI